MKHRCGELPEVGYWRGLVIQASLLTVVLLLVVSPLPEWVLGNWLRLENSSRDTLGRAHERRSLAEESQQAADELSRTAEVRRHTSGEIASIGALRDYLERYGELTLTRREFLEFYSILPEKQATSIVSPDSLLSLVYNGNLQRTRFLQSTEVSGSTELLMIDTEGARLARFMLPLSDRRDQELGFTTVATADGPFELSGVVVELPFEAWVQQPDTIAECRQAVTRLALDPYYRVTRVLRNAQGTIYVELQHEEKWSLKRLVDDRDRWLRDEDPRERHGIGRIWPWSRQ